MISKRILFQEPGLKELKKDYTFVDMHVHTNYSSDCKTPVNALLKKAAKLGIGLSITDHVRAEAAIKAAKQKKVLIIPGIEVNCYENKEVLFYFYSVKDLKDFYEKYVKNRIIIKKEREPGLTKKFKIVIVNTKIKEMIEKADKYNCLLSLPHPYTFPTKRSHHFFARKKRRDLLKKIHAIEVFNASMPRQMNKKATKWALKENKAFTAGSDAHNINEVGEGVVASKANNVEEFLESIRKKKNLVIGKEIKLSKVLKEFIDSMKYKRKHIKELYRDLL